jgi:hypothetical protein
MKTPAIIASLTVVGSIAYAAGSQGTAGKQPPVMPSGSQAHSMQEETPQSLWIPEGGCNSGVDKNWFTTGHLLPSCAIVGGVLPASAPDVNGDGIRDLMFANPLCPQGGGYPILSDGVPSTTALLAIHEFSTATGTYSDSISCVMRGEAGAFHKSQVPSDTNVCAQLYLWDMDNDGDLDLVVDAGSIKFWLENTGFQHSNHIAADLNHDGTVNGADMGLLLYAWGPNQ